jgi:hypothetical protein
MIYWLSTCQELQENNSKTINITFLSYLPCHGIPDRKAIMFKKNKMENHESNIRRDEIAELFVCRS